MDLQYNSKKKTFHLNWKEIFSYLKKSVSDWRVTTDKKPSLTQGNIPLGLKISKPTTRHYEVFPIKGWDLNVTESVKKTTVQKIFLISDRCERKWSRKQSHCYTLNSMKLFVSTIYTYYYNILGTVRAEGDFDSNWIHRDRIWWVYQDTYHWHTLLFDIWWTCT